MGSKQSCTKQPTKLEKAYHVDIHQEDGSALLCIYTDPLADSLVKEIEYIVKNSVTKLSESFCRHEWAHLIIFNKEIADPEIRSVYKLLRQNGYLHTDILGRPW
jgi:hypothetical protein